MAMVAAARRGVDVTLIVPQKLDSRLVALASNPFQEDLVAAGVRVMLYQRGFLHTKSITVDDRISFFGSLNLDLRSFHLNFEITLAIYSQIFTRRLRRLQQRYISDSLQKTATGRLSAPRRLLENSVRLLAPLL
jgi:cardiolipin synthase